MTIKIIGSRRLESRAHHMSAVICRTNSIRHRVDRQNNPDIYGSIKHKSTVAEDSTEMHHWNKFHNIWVLWASSYMDQPVMKWNKISQHLINFSVEKKRKIESRLEPQNQASTATRKWHWKLKVEQTEHWEEN
jgi:hypothetical protein